MTRLTRILAIALAALLLTTLTAQAGKLRNRPDLHMTATGHLVIDEQGKVASHQLDHPEKLPAGIVQMVADAATTWRFEPVTVDGKVVRARARMSLAFFAEKQRDGDYSVTLKYADFGSNEVIAGLHPVPLDMSPPNYPTRAAEERTSGVVYLGLKIGRDGSVEDVFAERVNLTVDTGDREPALEKRRRLLANAAMRAARQWRFEPPTSGPLVDDPYWTAIAPINFSFTRSPSDGDSGLALYGKWEPFIPGKPETRPWFSAAQPRDQSPEAMIAGRFYTPGAGLKLLTPLDKG